MQRTGRGLVGSVGPGVLPLALDLHSSHVPLFGGTRYKLHNDNPLSAVPAAASARVAEALDGIPFATAESGPLAAVMRRTEYCQSWSRLDASALRPSAFQLGRLFEKMAHAENRAGKLETPPDDYFDSSSSASPSPSPFSSSSPPTRAAAAAAAIRARRAARQAAAASQQGQVPQRPRRPDPMERQRTEVLSAMRAHVSSALPLAASKVPLEIFQGDPAAFPPALHFSSATQALGVLLERAAGLDAHPFSVQPHRPLAFDIGGGEQAARISLQTLLHQAVTSGQRPEKLVAAACPAEADTYVPAGHAFGQALVMALNNLTGPARSLRPIPVLALKDFHLQLLLVEFPRSFLNAIVQRQKRPKETATVHVFAPPSASAGGAPLRGVDLLAPEGRRAAVDLLARLHAFVGLEDAEAVRAVKELS